MLTLVDLSALYWPCYFVNGDAPGAFDVALSQVQGIFAGNARTIVCCEGRNPFRYEMEPNYKANRPPRPDAAREALAALIGEICDLGIPLVSVDHMEADDTIATLATQATEPVHIVGQDKDLMQLLSPTVSMIINGKLCGPDHCVEKFGVRPDQLRDYLAICGDASDNIKGCPGIGGKGAARLLQRFGSLEAIRAAADEELELGPKTLAKFRAWDPTLAVKLVSLLTTAPITIQEILPIPESIEMADMSKIVTERTRGPLKILAYGPEGVGKTRFGAFSVKPIFLCAENGLSAPDLRNVPSFPAPDSWSDVMDAIKFLTTTEHDHKTLVVDSLDWLHQHARAAICKRENMSPSQYEDYGRGEKHAFELWVQLMNAIAELQEKRGMHVIMIAHSSMETFQNPQGEDFVRYQLALSKKAAERWKQWPDFLLFMSQEMFTKKSKDDKSSKGIIGDYRIFTQRSAAYDAKNRINLPGEIAYETENPWRPFAAAVREAIGVNNKPPVDAAAPAQNSNAKEAAPAA
jgi:5'-3' exonuclease